MSPNPRWITDKYEPSQGWDKGGAVSRCRDCKALIQYECDLCENCHAEWIGWLQKRDKETADVPLQR